MVDSLTLGQKQRLFMSLLPELLLFIYEQGYECTLGDGYRDERAFGKVGVKKCYGKAFSLHKERLAIDLNLFVDGKWIQTSDHEAWTILGEYWEGLHPLCVNGRHFDDANHFSLEHEGRH